MIDDINLVWWWSIARARRSITGGPENIRQRHASDDIRQTQEEPTVSLKKTESHTEKNTWYKLTHSGESTVYRVIVHK